MKEVNGWDKELKSVFEIDKLQKEANAIGSPITVEEFVRFFKTKENQLSYHQVEAIWGTTTCAQQMKI